VEVRVRVIHATLRTGSGSREWAGLVQGLLRVLDLVLVRRPVRNTLLLRVLNILSLSLSLCTGTRQASGDSHSYRGRHIRLSLK
jgi:hypothetical protein